LSFFLAGDEEEEKEERIGKKKKQKTIDIDASPSTGCPASVADMRAGRSDLNPVIFGGALFRDGACRGAGCHEISLRGNLVQAGRFPHVCILAIKRAGFYPDHPRLDILDLHRGAPARRFG